MSQRRNWVILMAERYPMKLVQIAKGHAQMQARRIDYRIRLIAAGCVAGALACSTLTGATIAPQPTLVEPLDKTTERPMAAPGLEGSGPASGTTNAPATAVHAPPPS